MSRRATTLDRLRERCADNVVVVLAALVVLIAVGGWMTYTIHVAPPTVTEDREVGALTAEADYEHAATVEEENPIFPVGSNLRDRELYFTNVSPTLGGVYRYTFETTTAESVSVETELALRTRAVDGETEYWSERRTIGTDRVEAADGSGILEVPFTVNVPETEQRIAEIEQELGGSPGSTETALVARTTVIGTVAGEPIEKRDEHLLTIQPAGATYRVDSEGVGETRTAVTEPATTTHHVGPVRSYGAPLLLLLSLGLFSAIGILRYRGALRPSADVRGAMAEARTRRALDDWITVGRVPPSYGQKTVVAVDSLAGLVDVAIDSNRRVIEDRERGRYFVAFDEWVYAYPPRELQYEPSVELDSETELPDTTGSDREAETPLVETETAESESSGE